jgi:hypothetical protein
MKTVIYSNRPWEQNLYKNLETTSLWLLLAQTPVKTIITKKPKNYFTEGSIKVIIQEDGVAKGIKSWRMYLNPAKTPHSQFVQRVLLGW